MTVPWPTPDRRVGLWGRIVLACTLLAIATGVLVTVEALVVGVLSTITVFGVYSVFGLVLPDPVALSLTTIVFAVVLVGVWIVVRTLEAAPSAAESTSVAELEIRITLAVTVSSVIALAAVLSVLPVTVPDWIRIPGLAFFFLYAYTVALYVNGEWLDNHGEDVDPEQFRGVSDYQFSKYVGRTIAALESDVDRRTVVGAIAAVLAGSATVYTTASVASPTRVGLGLAAVGSLVVVGVHLREIARSELEDGAVRRELESTLGGWIDGAGSGSAHDDGDASDGCGDDSCPDDDIRLRERMRRLAMGADVPTPEVRVASSRAPTAAAVGYRPAESTIVVTRGLLGTLSDRELDAVLAHEFAHVANRDAAILTLLSYPGVSARTSIDRYKWNPILTPPALFVSVTSRLCVAVVARAREYAADDGAVAITGDPAGLASALETLDRELAIRPTRDLRGVAGSFSIVPPPWDERQYHDRLYRFVFRRILGTHPPTTRRLERLEARLRDRDLE